MKSKTKLIILTATYVAFMLYFTLSFLPMFTEAVGGYEMVDAYLVDYTKSILDIENLVLNYGESGRAFMTNFFIADSIYVIISAALFYSLIRSVTQNKYLSYIPLVAGGFDTLENIIVLYTGNTLNMDYIIFARIFATTKAFLLLITIIIIVVGLVKKLRKNKIPN